MFGWTFFEPYRQMAASIPKNLLTRHGYMTNQGTTKHRCLGMPHSTGLCSSTLRMDDATTPSSIMTSVHDTSTAGTPTPNDPDLDE
jgi:hypothetical protein